MKRPDLTASVVNLDLAYVNRLLGSNLTAGEVKGLLERMRFGVSVSGGVLKVSIPAYRTDILHSIDLVEDVAIAYGYMNFTPELPKLPTLGKTDDFELFANEIRDCMTGLGFIEIMSLVMTNKNDLFARMNVKEEAVVETVGSVSQEHSVGRSWLLPSLMGVLGKNKNREYPQKLFEIGDCLNAEGKDERKLCGVIAHSRANFSEVKAIVCGLLDGMKMKYDISPATHGSFISGRCAKTKNGFFGEISPVVLENFGLEVPVAAFEMNNLEAIFL